MRLSPFLHVLGIWLLLFSGALLAPVVISLLYRDGEVMHFSLALLANLFFGLLLWLPTAGRDLQLRKRAGFVIVVMLWSITSLLGTLPFLFGIGMSFTDSVFESVSAFTTTGATVITGLDALPPSILFFRQEMQWLGGIGVVVSAIAILPMLGVGGMQMFKAETPGPMKDEKLTPRIAHAAQILWKLYIAMTVACAVLYWLGGMSVFDAVAHSLATVSTGGFSTHDASLAYFHSVFIETVATIFMLIGGINFSVHYLVWRNQSLFPYWKNAEVRTFLTVVAMFAVMVSGVLFSAGTKGTYTEAFHYAIFTVVSVITSTGFGIDDFSVWPTLLPAMLMFISFIGGCAGSTAGGMKVIRFMVLGKGMELEMQQLVHPRRVQTLQIDNKPVAPRVADAVRGFISLYIVTFIVIMLFLMSQDLDQVTAFSAVASCMNNLGPGLGEVAANFKSIPDPAKWALSFSMLLGRLEIFTFLVVLSPEFWLQ